jgi:hypothetical protein
VQQDDAVFQFDDHLLSVRDEIGAQIAAVELHALDHFGFGLQPLVFLDGDHAFVADLGHRICDLAADGDLSVGGNGADLRDLVAVANRSGHGLDLGHDRGDGLVDPALEIHRVHAGGDRLHALPDNRMGENGRGRGAVARLVIGALRDLLDHLRAHVLEMVRKLDFLGDGHAVLGDARRPPGFVEDDVSALGSKGDLHGVGQRVDAFQHAVAGIGTESDVFGGHGRVLLRMKFRRRCRGQAMTPRMSLSFMIMRSSPSSLISVPTIFRTGSGRQP